MRTPLVTTFASLFLTAGALAQSTAFTYQGRLRNGAAPASGLHDFRFRLFNAASGGTQIGAQQCVDNVQVSEGLFATTLDFGQQFATTAARFLEVEVRQDTGLNCGDPAGFVVLSPRQLLTAAPLATHAKSAFSLDAADGTPNAIFVDNTGKVGIGTTTPTHSVHIAKPEPTLALQDTDSSGLAGGQQVGYVSYRDNGNVERGWIGYGSPGDPDLSIINARPGGDIVLNTVGGGNIGIGTVVPAAMLDVGGSGLFSGSLGVVGSVGIGTNAPAAKLDVRGNIRLGSSGQFFATGGEENLRIVRGMVSVDGVILSGSGFSATHDGVGRYTLTFSPPFASLPTVTITVGNSRNFDAGFAYLRSVSFASASLEIVGMFSNDQFSENFNFIAIGPR